MSRKHPGGNLSRRIFVPATGGVERVSRDYCLRRAVFRARAGCTPGTHECYHRRGVRTPGLDVGIRRRPRGGHRRRGVFLACGGGCCHRRRADPYSARGDGWNRRVPDAVFRLRCREGRARVVPAGC